MEANTINAFSNAFLFNISEADLPSKACFTANLPVSTPTRNRAPDAAGGVAPAGIIKPIVSARQAIVEAVPITMQVPAVGHKLFCTSLISSASNSSALN